MNDGERESTMIINIYYTTFLGIYLAITSDALWQGLKQRNYFKSNVSTWSLKFRGKEKLSRMPVRETSKNTQSILSMFFWNLLKKKLQGTTIAQKHAVKYWAGSLKAGTILLDFYRSTYQRLKYDDSPRKLFFCCLSNFVQLIVVQHFKHLVHDRNKPRSSAH